MKRHPGLRKFSEDHHRGLVQARRLRRAAEGEDGEKRREAGRGFLAFWREDTSAHFRLEEDVLLPVYARYGGDLEAEPVVQTVKDHALIRGLVMELEEQVGGGEVGAEVLREAGERLDEHIRLEERRLFPLVEQTLAEEELQEIGRRVAGKGEPGSGS